MAAWLTLLYLGVVAIITLGPTLWRTRPADGDYDVLSPSTWLDPATWTRLDSAEFVANILLFVPIGFLLRLALPRATWFGAVVLGGGVSVAIEILQMWTPRVSDPRDILANTTGALVGALVAALADGVRRAVVRASSAGRSRGRAPASGARTDAVEARVR